MSLQVVQSMLQLYNEIGEVVHDPKTYGKQGHQIIMDTGVIEVSLVYIQRPITFQTK